MPVYRLADEVAFPPPEEAEPGGLLAVGGDLRPERLLLAYSMGIFPWYDEEPILWFSPEPRMALCPSELHVARRLERTLRQGRFAFSLDRAFPAVIEACAQAPRREQDGTWINPDMIRAYTRLHELGFAHSCEAWQGGELVGGVYGISLGSAFFAESMFHRATDASKAAFVTLVRELAAWEFTLIDCQMHTDHLARFGATEWSRERFQTALARATAVPTRRGPWRLAE
ncbi:MAG: leucyl/phenylalanyl-tRNA--protein transferase [Deltaproteobacteria bacterium]|jgi:leucyl/phenylalanyl-tRNA--protein transferase|nr:leucyl/phenylalanyl-tRNA--protein transferase [Deltaproteobacteria bacterium]